MALTPTDRAAEILEHKRHSHSWMESNFYAQWEQVYKAYLCERTPETDPNTGKIDMTRTVVGAPDTWATVNRQVARVTAQPPNLRFRCDDRDIANLISTSLMYQWDEAGIQRIQKKHVRQGCLFGWSVRPWYWDRQMMIRRKRVNPFDPATTPETLAAIQELYAQDLAGADVRDPQVMALLLAARGKGKLLPVESPYVAYEGPQADWLFVGDCYPEPGFQSIQASRWFVVERRRDRAWLESMARAVPELAQGIADLLARYPKGSPRKFWGTGETGTLRQRLNTAVNQQAQDWWQSQNTEEWTVTEEHVPGLRPRLALLGEDSILLGEIPYPYDLDGKIAFSELLFMDNLLHGVGDSSMRVLRGIQELHSRMISTRADVFDYGLRPLVGTSDIDLYENPSKIKPHGGFRLVHMPNGPQSLWFQDSSAALAAAGATFGEEANYARQWQAGSGDSNISMMAGVDPQQARTATGARLLSAALDTLTRDAIDMFTQTSLREDAELMYLLNRSEMSDAIEFDGSAYARGNAARRGAGQQAWMKVEPLMFQVDGRITVETGSTLADDDEARVERAQTLYSMFAGNPLIDQKKLVADVLVAFGKQREIDEYLADEPPGGPPEPPVKGSMSVSGKLDMLPPEVQVAMLQGAGYLPPTPPPGAIRPEGEQGPPPPEQAPEQMPEPMEPPEPQGMLEQAVEETWQ
jgi:hypothetical protein